jgi:hypothetical protein
VLAAFWNCGLSKTKTGGPRFTIHIRVFSDIVLQNALVLRVGWNRIPIGIGKGLDVKKSPVQEIQFFLVGLVLIIGKRRIACGSERAYVQIKGLNSVKCAPPRLILETYRLGQEFERRDIVKTYSGS